MVPSPPPLPNTKCGARPRAGSESHRGSRRAIPENGDLSAGRAASERGRQGRLEQGGTTRMKARLPIFEVGAWAYDWLTSQPIWRQQITKVLDHVDVRPGLRVLDLGCGPGVSSFALAEALGPGAEVVGIDNAKQMIRLAEGWHKNHYAHLQNVRFLAADATSLPFGDGEFDLAVGHSFLYLVPDRVGVLREAKRLLGATGRLVLMEPNRDGSLAAAAAVGWQRRHTLDASSMAQLRFGLSLVLWRVASAAAGRMHPDLIAELFSQSGFSDGSCSPTLGGLGLHCVGDGTRSPDAGAPS